MRTITTTVYRVDELKPDVRQRVVNEHRLINLNHDWYDAVYDDFTVIAEILGVSLNIGEPKFSGFSSQGDGASFTGTWSYNTQWHKQLTDHAPADTDLHEIGAALEGIALDYDATAWVRLDRTRFTHYVHEKTVTITESECVTSGGDVAFLPVDAEEQILYQLRRLMQWLYQQLQNEYDYLTSDEAIIETLTAHDYEFLADGTIYHK
jgi:hypothetical protein